jgi:hypothetical protein
MSGVERHKTAPPFMLEKLIEVGQHQLARDGDFSGVIHVGLSLVFALLSTSRTVVPNAKQ